MKMPCKCHPETPDLLIATGCSSGPLRCTYFSPLKWKHCCPLVTWQCVHLAEDPLKSRIVESLRWTVFSRWEETTPAASDIAIRWGAAKNLDFRKLHSLFSWVCMGLWGLHLLCCSYLTMVWQPYVSEPWLRTLWGATVFGWHLASPDGDVLAYTNLTYATLTSRFGVPHVSFGWWWMVDNLPTFYLFQQDFRNPLAFPKTDWLLRYTAKAGDVINGTGINEVCIQPAKLAGLGGDPVEGVEVGFCEVLACEYDGYTMQQFAPFFAPFCVICIYIYINLS